MGFKKTIVIGFDRILHDYDGKWLGATEINGDIIPGSLEFLETILNSFKVHVISPRSATKAGRDAMYAWCAKNYGYGVTNCLEFSEHAPPAWVTLDYRLMPFTGEFPSLEDLNTFQPIGDTFKLKQAQAKLAEATQRLLDAQHDLDILNAELEALTKKKSYPTRKRTSVKK